MQGQSRLWQPGGTTATEGDRSPLVTNFNKVWRLNQADHLPRLARSVSSANSRVDPNRPLTLQYCPRRYDYRCWPTLLHVLTHHSGQLLFRLGYRVYLAQFCIVAEFLKRGTLWHPGTPTDFFLRVANDQYERLCGRGGQVIRREKVLSTFHLCTRTWRSICKVSGCSKRRRLIPSNHFVVYQTR